MQPSTVALMSAAAAVGALHTVAPDHWMPFAALSRSRRWSARHTARVTLLCGFGHVSVSALLAVGALFAGMEAMRAFGSRLETNANLLLMAFGTVYMIWGLWRSFRRDPLSVVHHHHHRHEHGRNDHDHGLTEWSLFLLFSADPCVAVIPMVIASSGAGWLAVGSVIAAYEVATLGTMILLVIVAARGAEAMRFAFLDRFGDVVAGALIVTLGAALTAFSL